jgi:hypothetical protein
MQKPGAGAGATTGGGASVGPGGKTVADAHTGAGAELFRSFRTVLTQGVARERILRIRSSELEGWVAFFDCDEVVKDLTTILVTIGYVFLAAPTVSAQAQERERTLVELAISSRLNRHLRNFVQKSFS